MEHKQGTWVWSTTHKQPVLIINTENLWNTEIIQAWLPTQNKTTNLNPQKIHNLGCKPTPTSHEIKYITTATKIINLLSSKKPTTPLQANIIPLPHQIYTYKRATENNQIRYLLADEVGLGKTIEAGLILKKLKKQNLIKRILIASPRGLIKQWIDEMKLRFNEEFHLVNPGKNLTYEEQNIWEQQNQIICSMDAVKPIKNRSGWSEEKLEKYNKKRFQDLTEAKWDLVIVDEAHKLSGSTTGVARHELGVALSETTPYLLLLSATPHQGKTEQFKRLMALLDPKTFEKTENIKTENVKKYVIRTEKKIAVDPEGKPLFMPRITQLVPVEWSQAHKHQRQLYSEITEYVRYGYNKAIEEKRNYIGFLMVLMQRLVSSSTRAIRQTLERRKEILETTPSLFTQQDILEDLWSDTTGQQKLDQILTKIGEGIRDEKNEVLRLASLARKAEVTHPDAKAEKLLEIIYKQKTEEQNPNLKFLIFTEFIPTQEMLLEFLKIRGFNVVTLNGSMSLKERVNAQNKFADQADILISTEAGGEGINLQFCHIVFNYDLPWNPMRIEQRIGRIDRIGQKHPVKVYNLVFNNTIEQRVRQVLEEKLDTILEEFGVDKLNDVLDADETETDFEKIYREALLKPEAIEETVNQYLSNIRKNYSQTIKDKNLIQDEKQLDITEAQELSNHPLPYWIEQMTINYIKAYGGTTEKTDNGYNLTWPDGTIMKNISFKKDTYRYEDILTLNNKKIIQLLENLIPHIKGIPIPKIQLENLPPETMGLWSLWEITVSNQEKTIKKILPIFRYDDGRTRISTANQLWNHLTQQTTKIKITGTITGEKSKEIYEQLKKIVMKQGEDKLIQAQQELQDYLEKQKTKQEKYYNLQQRSISKIKQIKEKDQKIKNLQNKHNKWLKKHQKNKIHYISLQAYLIIHVRGKNE